PAAWRKPIYAVFAVIGVGLGAVASAYGPEHVPAWHAVTMNVYLYVGGALGFTAAANTIVGGKFTGDESVVPEPDELAGVTDTAEDDLEVTDEDPLTEGEDDPTAHDLAQADAQAQLDAALLNEVDLTPPPEGYEPRH